MMEYNQFLRVYYSILMEHLRGFELDPENVIFDVYDDEDNLFNETFFEDKGGKELEIKLGSPNYIYEDWFEKKAQMFPEYLFYLDREGLRTTSQMVNNPNEIEELISSLILCYKELGTIKDGISN